MKQGYLEINFELTAQLYRTWIAQLVERCPSVRPSVVREHDLFSR